MTDAQAQKQYEAQMEYASSLINAYQRNPNAFTDSQLKEVKALSDYLGLGWEPRFSAARAVQKGVFELADTALLGLLPDEWGPAALTSGEETAGTIGGLLGLAVPGAAALKLGGAAAKGAKSVAKWVKEGSPLIQKGAKELDAIKRLRTLSNTVKNPKLRAFYRGALARSIAGINTAAGVAGRGIAAASRFPRAIKYGVAAPTFLGITDMFERGSEEPEEY